MIHANNMKKEKIAIYCISCEVSSTITGRNCENCQSGNWLTEKEALAEGI